MPWRSLNVAVYSTVTGSSIEVGVMQDYNLCKVIKHLMPAVYCHQHARYVRENLVLGLILWIIKVRTHTHV